MFSIKRVMISSELHLLGAGAIGKNVALARLKLDANFALRASTDCQFDCKFKRQF
jgi:hypothetical protein